MISLKDIFISSGSWRIKQLKLVDFFIGGLIAFFIPFSRGVAKPLGIKKMLIIRPGGIGDAVFLLPVLLRLKSMGITVDVLCERRNAEVFSSQGNLIANLYLYDRLGSFFALPRNEYDVVIDTEQWHYLSGVLACLVNSPVKIGFSTRPLRAKFFNICVTYDQGYELENFRRLFDTVVRDSFTLPLSLEKSFRVPDNAVQWVRAEPRMKNAVSLFLGASIPDRRLTFEQWKGIVSFFLSAKMTPVLIGGADAADIATALELVFGDKIINKVGKLDLGYSAAVISQSRCFLGADSGLLHIAAALGVPTFGVFGPGNAVKWGPKGINDKIIFIAMPCSPCTRFGYTLPTCKGEFTCMRSLNIVNLLKQDPFFQDPYTSSAE
ncbi:MAG: glycosyltransferase family 9 protein [Candidatus Omnitrophica bacterium]|nr:glycosyltransferase family 9 protein [Candidatus Omnitrophota bacterium]